MTGISRAVINDHNVARLRCAEISKRDKSRSHKIITDLSHSVSSGGLVGQSQIIGCP